MIVILYQAIKEWSPKFGFYKKSVLKQITGRSSLETPSKEHFVHYLLKITSGHLKNGKVLQIHQKKEDQQHHSYVKIVNFDVMCVHQNRKSAFMLA